MIHHRLVPRARDRLTLPRHSAASGWWQDRHPHRRDWSRLSATSPGSGWALQRGKDVVQEFPADGSVVTWQLDAERIGTDLRGAYIHGRPGDRFIYLVSWQRQGWGHIPEGQADARRPAARPPFPSRARSLDRPCELGDAGRQPAVRCESSASTSSGGVSTADARSPCARAWATSTVRRSQTQSTRTSFGPCAERRRRRCRAGTSSPPRPPDGGAVVPQADPLAGGVKPRGR